MSKVLEANDKTELLLDFKNAYAQIEESPDSNIYLDYSIDFRNYSIDEIESVLKGLSTNISQNDDLYSIKISSKNTMSSKVYLLESDFGFSMDKAFDTGEQTKRKFKKTKESFKTIPWNESKAEVFLETLRKFKANAPYDSTEIVDLSTVKSYSVKFIIKVPQLIKLKLELEKSELQFKYNASNQIACKSKNSTIRSQGFSNSLSNFYMDKGQFKVYEVSGGHYTFKDLRKLMIGSFENVVIDSEFSDFSIGEVGENSRINDFNSQFWLYGFSSEIGIFTMNTEYSKINLYYPEDMKYYIETFGHDTVHYWDNLITEIRPNRKNESSKMMVIGNEKSPNKIQINTIHGIIRFGEDFIDFGK